MADVADIIRMAFKKRRQSFSEEPSLLRKISGFTPEPRAVFNSDDEDEVYGNVELPTTAKATDSEMRVDFNTLNDANSISDLKDEGEPLDADEKIEGIVFRGNGFEQTFPTESRTIVGLLEAILSGDDSAAEVDCGNKCTAFALELTYTYVTHRLENKPLPFSYKVPSLPCQMLRISDEFDLELLRELSLEHLLELARCSDYLQVDLLLDAIYKYITIMLSECSQDQIAEFLQSANWPEQSTDMDVCGDQQEEDEGMDILDTENKEDLDIYEVLANLAQTEKLELIPNDCIEEIDLDAILRRNGAISCAISQLRDKTITPHPLIEKMPIMFWGKIADHSSAQKKLILSKTQAILSPVLTFEMQQLSGAENEMVFPVKECNRDALRYCVKYLQYHNGIQPAEISKPIRSVKMSKIVEDQWDADFVNSMLKQDLFQVTKAANHLQIQCLLHLCCAKVATMIKGKSPEEIKQILGEEN